MKKNIFGKMIRRKDFDSKKWGVFTGTYEGVEVASCINLEEVICVHRNNKNFEVLYKNKPDITRFELATKIEAKICFDKFCSLLETS